MARVLWRLAAACGAAVSSGAACAEIIFQTPDPFGGFLGLNGFDVFQGQSVAARFVPQREYTFTSIGLWFMSNDDSHGAPATVTVTLRADGGSTSTPTGAALETWTLNVPANGWNPALLAVSSATLPVLQAGTRYWVVAESRAAAGVDPVWLWSHEGNEYTATRQGAGQAWQAGNGAALALVVEGRRTGPICCSSDYNGDGDTGTDADIEAFFACLAGTCGPSCWHLGADFNADGDVGTDADIEAFFRVLAGNPC